jgi:hypothetical protein
MELLHALSIKANDLKEQLRNISDEELEDLYNQFTDEDNVREGDDFHHSQVLVAQEWKRRTCQILPHLLP